MTSEVYPSTNLPPFTRGQNSILNWVLKLNPLNLEIKKFKTVYTAWRELYSFFFTFRSHQWSKKSIQNKIKSRENKMCVWQTSFSYFF